MTRSPVPSPPPPGDDPFPEPTDDPDVALGDDLTDQDDDDVEEDDLDDDDVEYDWDEDDFVPRVPAVASLLSLDRCELPDGRLVSREVHRRAGESDAAWLARRADAAKAWLADDRFLPSVAVAASLAGLWRSCPLARCRRARACLGRRHPPGAAPRWITPRPDICLSPDSDGDLLAQDMIGARMDARAALRAAGLLPPEPPPYPPPRPAPVARQPSRKGGRS